MTGRHRIQFRLSLVLQVLLIVLFSGVFAWTWLSTAMMAVPLVVALLIGLQVYALIRSVEAHIDSLEDFFAAINYEDFTRRFVEEDVDAKLKEAFNKISGKIPGCAR